MNNKETQNQEVAQILELPKGAPPECDSRLTGFFPEPEYLKEKELVRYQGSVWRVAAVNESWAHIVPLTKKKVKITDKLRDKNAEFEVQQRGVDISPVARECVITEAKAKELMKKAKEQNDVSE